jgi:hypothetical protein
LTTDHEKHIATRNKPLMGITEYIEPYAFPQINFYFLYANMGQQVHNTQPAAIKQSKDLIFEGHYPLDRSIALRTSHPRVTTNTPKEIVESSSDHEM